MWLFVVGAALATEPLKPPPDFRIYYDSLSVARVNPLGLQEKFNLHARWRLLDKPVESTLFGDTWASVGATAAATPAWARGGVFAQVSPISILRLTASYEGIGYFGTFDQVQGFADPATADYSPKALEAGDPRAVAGTVLSLEGRVQAKVGPIAVRNTTLGARYNLAVDAGDVAFVDQIFDAMIPTKGWTIQNDTDVLYVAGRFSGGLRWTHLAPQLDSEEARQRAQIDRLGPLLSYRIVEDRGSGFDAATLFLLPQWHLRHPYRAGQEVSQAIPYVVLGFGFVGDAKPW